MTEDKRGVRSLHGSTQIIVRNLRVSAPSCGQTGIADTDHALLGRATRERSGTPAVKSLTHPTGRAGGTQTSDSESFVSFVPWWLIKASKCLTNHKGTRNAQHRARRGITLMEVLISIFVVAVGLLGVAALIPVGRFSVTETSKNDRAAALGRAAWRDIKVRGILEAPRPSDRYDHRWLGFLSGNPTQTVWLDTDVVNNITSIQNPLDRGNSVCIDPLAISHPSYPATVFSFPVGLDNDPALTSPSGVMIDSGPDTLTLPSMLRITLNVAPSPIDGQIAPMPAAMADRIFTWRDDLLFSLPDDDTLRPQRVFSRDTSGGNQYGQYVGDYSWMITITPAGNEGPGNVDAPGSFTVSVVVFYKRDLVMPQERLSDRGGAPPAERVVYADLLTPIGLGGGTVRLRLPVNSGDLNNTTDPERSDMTDVRPGQWIMLSWWTPLEVTSPTLPFNYRAVHHWYRVIAAGDPIPPEMSGAPGTDAWRREVTLAGPDWRDRDLGTGTTMIVDADADPSTGAQTVHATLMSGAIGVFSKTMTIDTTSGLGEVGGSQEKSRRVRNADTRKRSRRP